MRYRTVAALAVTVVLLAALIFTGVIFKKNVNDDEEGAGSSYYDHDDTVTSSTIVPAQPSMAPDGYFSDAAFVGNSLFVGLQMYGDSQVLEGADFYAENGLSVPDSGKLVDAMVMSGKQYAKIYVDFGVNELGFDLDNIRSAFCTLIDRLKQNNPGAVIYLTGSTPVSRGMAQSNPRFSREEVLKMNEMILGVAEEKQVCYLNSNAILADENGYLPDEATTDGIHFRPEHYERWLTYFRLHYIP